MFSICNRCFWYTKRSGVPSDCPALIARQDARKPHILEQRHHHACRDNTDEVLTGCRTPSPSCRGASPSSLRRALHAKELARLGHGHGPALDPGVGLLPMLVLHQIALLQPATSLRLGAPM